MAKIKQGRNIAFIIFVVCVILHSLVPTKEEAAMIYVVPKLTNSEQLQKEAGEIYIIAKDYMADVLEVKPVESTKN